MSAPAGAAPAGIVDCQQRRRYDHRHVACPVTTIP